MEVFRNSLEKNKKQSEFPEVTGFGILMIQLAHDFFEATLENHKVKIADFGCSKWVQPGESMLEAGIW